MKGNFIKGEFVIPKDTNGEWTLKSPADLDDEIGKVSYSYSAIDEAVSAAREAFPSWRRLAQADRNEFLKKYQIALKRHEEDLMKAMAREVGKPLWECKTEVTAMVNKIDVTLNESLKYATDFEIPKIMPDTHGVCRYRPLGVAAVIGPFNFPGHLPNGHLVPALATGNTVIFKPSEKSPLVGEIMAECFREAGFPPGVFNLLQGEKEVSRRLCVHEGVDAVLFTGSYEVGLRIKQDTLPQYWKLLALEMGGKNSSIIWKDWSNDDLDFVIHENLVASFITAGQRCSATSRILVHREVYDRFVRRFHEAAKAFSIGHPFTNPFMGPVIDAGSVDRYLKFIGIAAREGCEVLMRGKALELEKKGHYVTPSICLVRDASLEVTKKSVFQQTELFGPCVSITPIEDLDHGIVLANATHYGLVSSVFTKDRAVYERCLDGLQMGLINWNKTTVGASSRLPFGGLKKSGNHWPTALSATLYCTYPLASLEVAEPQMPSTSNYPGLNWGK